MRKLLISTTALSVALGHLAPAPGFAQVLNEDGSVTGPDGSVLCLPTAEAACDLEAITRALEEQRALEEALAAEELRRQEEEAAAAEAARLAEEARAAEAAAAAEAARLAEEAAAAEAAAAEEAARLAEEARAAEEAAAAEAARLEEEQRLAEEAAAAAEAEAARIAEELRIQEEAAAAEAARIAEELRLQEEAAAAAAAAEAAAEEVIVEEAPVEEAPAEEVIVEEAPVEEAPAEEVIVEEAPVEEAPAEEVIVEEAPVEEAPAEEVIVEEAPVEEAPAEEVIVEEAPVEEAPAEEVIVEEAPVEEAPAEEVIVEEAPVEEAPAEEVAVEEAPAEEGSVPEVTILDEAPLADRAEIEDASELIPDATAEAVIEALPEGAIDPATGAPLDAEAAAAAAAALEAAQSELQFTETGEIIDPAAGLKVAETEAVDPAEAVDAPVISETEVESLTELLTVDPTAIDPQATVAAATLAEPASRDDGAVTLAPAEADDLIAAVTETITEGSVRSSAEEFASAPVALSEGRKSGLSDLEKAGLVVLGALVVGSIIKSANDRREEERRVVSNTGDRVIVLRPDGSYQVLKDDDTIIRRPGSTVRTETFRDGSTRTIVEREDGTQVVTIRDATGRVLRRATYDRQGREIILIDDLAREEVVVVEELPRPRSRIVISSSDSDSALKRELAALEAERAGRKFSLRQIREIPEVRALAAVIDTQNVTFASGSSAIAPSEARNLADLGRVMQDLLEVNPGEVFLIEGHTDATGTAALNLALSDRRAESVALALTEYFDIPPENMVVQGYGETELLIDTQASEPRNRRVEVRVITPLMRTAALR
jgi:outer membrane protein OmpA-like peptidoglycan-associated protein